MRKITEEAIKAFYANENFKNSNTEVVVNCKGTYLYLFNNLIARKCGERVQINMCGYNTSTTRERLNGLAGVSLTSRNSTPYLNGKEIDACEWYEVSK